jgi:hypothetical protein
MKRKLRQSFEATIMLAQLLLPAQDVPWRGRHKENVWWANESQPRARIVSTV